MSNSAMMLRRREALRVLAACMADWWLPRQLFAQRTPAARPRDRRVIVVTFGGGVRYEDTLAREGWVNIPHLASDIVPQGLVYPAARHEGLTGHFNSTGALVTGSRQNVDAYGSEAPVTPTIFELFRREHALGPEEACGVGIAPFAFARRVHQREVRRYGFVGGARKSRYPSACHRPAAVRSALRVNQTRTGELPENLGQIAAGDPGGPGQLGNGDRSTGLTRQLDHQPERVFRRLGQHWSHSAHSGY